MSHDERCFYVAYAGHGEDIKVDVEWSSWWVVREKKRKTLQCVGGGSLTAGHAGNCNTARIGRGN